MVDLCDFIIIIVKRMKLHDVLYAYFICMAFHEHLTRAVSSVQDTFENTTSLSPYITLLIIVSYLTATARGTGWGHLEGLDRIASNLVAGLVVLLGQLGASLRPDSSSACLANQSDSKPWQCNRKATGSNLSSHYLWCSGS